MSPCSRHLLVIVALVTVVGLVQCRSKPKQASSYFTLCRKNDPALNECIKKSIMDARTSLVKGIPALNLVPLEPLVIPRLDLNQGSGNFLLKTSLTNFTIHGLSKYTVTNVSMFLDDKKFVMDMAMSTPEMIMTAGYEMAGQILVIPVQGKGTCEMNFTDVSTLAHTRGSVVDRAGKKYIELIDIKWDITINGKAKSWFYNLFNGDKRLGDATNNFLNSNAQDAFQAYKHLPEEAFGEIFKDLSSKVYAEYSIDELFPK